MNALAINNIIISIFIMASLHQGAPMGTYSTLNYNNESGDLNGIEIKIVQSEKGLVVISQFADNGINVVSLSAAKKDDEKIIFSISFEDKNNAKFRMYCAKKYCKGQYEMDGSRIPFFLPKNNGYWNSR